MYILPQSKKLKGQKARAELYWIDKSVASNKQSFLIICDQERTMSWRQKNWCFQTVVLEKTLQSPLDSKEIKPVNPNGNQPWIFIGSTDAEAEAPILWLPYVKSQLIGKDPDAGKDWKWEEKGQQRMRWLDGITNVMDMSLHASGNWWWTGKPGILKAMGWQRIGQNWVTESTEMTDKNSATRVVRTIE